MYRLVRNCALRIREILLSVSIGFRTNTMVMVNALWERKPTLSIIHMWLFTDLNVSPFELITLITCCIGGLLMKQFRKEFKRSRCAIYQLFITC